MDKKPNMIAIEIMAGKPKKGEKSSKVEPHMATCPNCGHEFMMGEEESSDKEEAY